MKKCGLVLSYYKVEVTKPKKEIYNPSTPDLCFNPKFIYYILF